MATWDDIKISIIITERVNQYLDFLQSYVSNEQYQRDDVLKRAVTRYETLWLPLCAQLKTTDLEPPRDVKWVWHLHMLKPTHYHNYCLEKFGFVIPHKIRPTVTEEKFARERTASIWKDRYMREPYELEPSLQTSDRYSRTNSMLLERVQELADQSDFLYQFALPHYKDKSFRAQSLDRYRKFLNVWRRNTADFQLQVPYDIQLMWRIHCLHPVEYYQNIEELSRGKDAVLDINELTSRNMLRLRNVGNQWSTLYTEALEAGGTGFRGTENLQSIDTFPKDKIPEQKVESCDIIINDIVISDFWSGEKKFVVEAKRLGDTSFTYTSIFMREGKVSKRISSTDEARGLGSIVFHAKYHRGIEFHIFSRSGSCCRKQEHHIATVFYNPRDACSEGSFFTRTLSVSIPKIVATDPSIKFTVKIKASSKESTVFSMDRGSFQMTEFPTKLQDFVDLQPTWEAIHTEEGDLPIITATHSLKSKVGGLFLQAEVVKCDPADLGAVMMHIKTGDDEHRLVAVAHSVGQEQLPTNAQVSKKHPLTMDANRGDQAMLIQNAAGNWAIIVGKWVQEDYSGDGKVEFSVYRFEDRSSETFEVRDDEMQAMQLGYVKVDMPTGRITMDADCMHIGETLTMAFCAGMIFLACQKRAIQSPAATAAAASGIPLSASSTTLDSMESGSQYTTSKYNNKAKMSKKKSRRRKMSASFTFLLANGLQMDSYYYSGPAPTAISDSNLSLNVLSKAGDVQFGSSNTLTRDNRKKSELSTTGVSATLTSFGNSNSLPTNGHVNPSPKLYKQNGHSGGGGVISNKPAVTAAKTNWNYVTDDIEDDKFMDIRL